MSLLINDIAFFILFKEPMYLSKTF